MLGNGVVPQQAELALRLLRPARRIIRRRARRPAAHPGRQRHGDGKAPNGDAWCDAMKAKHGNGNGHGKSLAVEVRAMTSPNRMVDATGTRHLHARRHGRDDLADWYAA